ncbi:hypothetical protein [Acinetobacter bouvetii]|uniref:Lipoprotein n=1 Tax=Acinetobacter bouvetii TaxID=202951 RepID=A0A811GBQ4_9GAMM|nr:hypothetical protein [Acinetobacter bouvetii]CAB1218930.1 hypothetical protein SFB21_2325 [Acinetobacter bouvetii]
MLLKADYHQCIFVVLIAGLTGCQQPVEDSVAKQMDTTTSAAAATQGKKLTDVAGQATIPVQQTESKIKKTIPKIAEPYIGRYQTTISCDDPFVNCKGGSSDFVVNLLEDGTAHRTMIHSGQITYTSNMYYHQDRWSYDPVYHQVILHRSSGVDFFYDVDKQSNLVMNLDKTAYATEINKQYFAEGNPFPKQAYRLKKEK